MTPRIYIDTSVVGGCFDEEFQEWSNKLFEEFRLKKKIAVLSDITIDELSFARLEVRNHLETVSDESKEYIFSNEESEELAEKYIAEGADTKKIS